MRRVACISAIFCDSPMFVSSKRISTACCKPIAATKVRYSATEERTMETSGDCFLRVTTSLRRSQPA
jgi:hypothetical protein